jgi:PAS domain S-box-containing protein
MENPAQNLAAYNQALERLLELFTAPNLSSKDRISQVLLFGADFLELSLAAIGHLDDDQYVLDYAIDPTGERRAGSAYNVDETFCTIAITSEEPVAVQSIPNSEFSSYSSCASSPIRTFIGAPIRIGGKISGAIGFGGPDDRDKVYVPTDITLVRLIANWLGGQFETEERTQGLVQSELRFKRLYRKLPLIAFTHDRNMIITDVSDFMLDHTGYTREEMIGRRTVEFAAEGVRARIQKVDHPVFWATGFSSCLPRPLIAKSGEVLEVELSSVAFEGPDGTFDTGHAVMVDVTDRNRAQAKLAQKNEELEQVNEQLRHFAYIASHDLQEPLRKIRMFGGQLSDETGDDLSTEGQFALDTMISAAERLSILVSDVLAYSRVSYAEFAVHKVKIRDVVTQVVTIFEEKIDEVDAEIDIGNLPVVQGDSVQINRLLMNLIGNAIKYTSPNLSPKISISGQYNPEKNATDILVSDNGIGFPNAYAEKIFQPFQRLNQRSMYSGSGIGLAVARTIAEKHGWTITARSEPGVGSVFTIHLPGVQMNTAAETILADEVA